MDNFPENIVLPRHIAIVMDGNGRWAQKRHLPVAAGHKVGVETVRAVLEAAEEFGVNNLTLFAFSSENWQRPIAEVNALMFLFSAYIDSEIETLAKRNVRVRFIGRRDRFPSELLKKINYAESHTRNCTNFNLTLAVDYGGQWDITEATKVIAAQVANGELSIDNITPELLGSKMAIADIPQPDLLIRTSGEYRISNFLLWQLAYAEFYFTEVFWPDFNKAELHKAILSFSQRDRRYGGRNEVNHA